MLDSVLNFIFYVDAIANTFFINLVQQENFLYEIFKFITFFGSFEFVSIFLILFSLYYLYEERFKLFGKYSKKLLFPLFSSLIISFMVSYFLKYYFLTPGPAGRTLLEFDPSFPSAHAATSVAFFGVIYFLYNKKIKNKNERRVFLLLILFMVFLVGLSRLVLDVHFLSDVLVGYIVGLFGLYCAILLSKKLD